MNGAESLVHSLLRSGVTTCFSNPGTSEMHFVAALDRVPGMHCVLGLFEGVVTGAADGYARMAGMPAATLLHCGPGLANGLANLHNARRAATPVVNIVGDQATYHRPLDPPLTADTEGWARGVSGWVRTSNAASTGWKRCRGGGAGLHDRTRAGGYPDPSIRHLLERRGCGRRSVAAAATAIIVPEPNRGSRRGTAPWGCRRCAVAGRRRAVRGRTGASTSYSGRHGLPRHRAGFKCAHGSWTGASLAGACALCRRCCRKGDGGDETSYPGGLPQTRYLLRLSEHGAILDPRRCRDLYSGSSGTRCR